MKPKQFDWTLENFGNYLEEMRVRFQSPMGIVHAACQAASHPLLNSLKPFNTLLSAYGNLDTAYTLQTELQIWSRSLPVIVIEHRTMMRWKNPTEFRVSDIYWLHFLARYVNYRSSTFENYVSEVERLIGEIDGNANAISQFRVAATGYSSDLHLFGIASNNAQSHEQQFQQLRSHVSDIILSFSRFS